MQSIAAATVKSVIRQASGREASSEEHPRPQRQTDLHSEKVVQECIGYGQQGRGRLWIVAWWLYSTLFFFVHLFARQWTVHLLKKCPLAEASFVLIKLVDGRRMLLRVQRYTMAASYTGLHHTQKPNGSSTAHRKLHVFKLFLRQYAYCREHDRFEAIPTVPAQVPDLLGKALDTLQAINRGAGWSRFNIEHASNRINMVQLYGNKKWLFRRNQVLGMSTRHALPAIFGIQTLELYYLWYRKYFYYAAVVSAISWLAIAGLVVVLSDQHKKLVGLVNKRHVVPIVERGWAVQVRKSSYVADKGMEYQPDLYHQCTVFAGTVVRQVWNAEDSEDEVLAMVVRVKLDTTMGSMVRELIAPVGMLKEKLPFEADVLRLYAFSFTLQLLLLIPYLIKAQHFQQTTKQVVLKALDLIVHAAPPAIPAVMLLCGFAVSFRLRKQGINLMFMEVLKMAADMEVVCFDKTGTLTGSVAEFHGMLPVTKGVFGPLQQNAVRWGNRLKQAAAVCNGLTVINKNSVVGEEFEQSLFKAVEARFKGRETVALPLKADTTSQARLVTLHILKVLPFNVQTLKSGVVIQADHDHAGSNTGLLFVRGAAGVIKSLVQPGFLPKDFDKGSFVQVVDDYSSKSFRLMAMAVGIIPNVGNLDLPSMSQQQVEAQAVDVELLALVVLTNHVRHDSKSTISELQERGGIRTMMITGDYHHTAIAVAKDVGMIPPDQEVIVLDAANASQAMSVQSAQRISFSASPLLFLMAPAEAGAVSKTRFASEHSAVNMQPAAASACASPSLSPPPGTLLKPEQRADVGPSTLEPLRALPVPSHRPQQEAADDSYHRHQSHGSSLGQLRVVMGLGAEEVGLTHALQTMACGHAQCAVTGAAFEQLLQMPDLTALETVMRNAVVFARMKPYQKGQVMDLLSVRGLHQMHDGCPRHLQGLGNTVMFCGDGINDLAALRAADIGFAVGATDATVAASLSTSHRSVAGVCQFIKEGKAGHSLILSLFKYMVVYQCIVTASGNIAFFLDGSSFSYLQEYTLDFQAISLGFAATVVPPMQQMSRHRPPAHVGIWPNFVLIGVMVLLFWCLDCATMRYMCTRAWYTGGNGTADNNPVNTIMWLTANFQLMGPIISLGVDTKLFVQRIFHKGPLPVLAAVYISLGTVAIMAGPATHANIFRLYRLPQAFRFRVEGLGIGDALLFIIFITVTRHILRRYQKRQIVPS